MLRRVLLPQLGQTMEEGTIAKWHKREGERVEKGEVLYELTTDKATLEVESFAGGVLKKVLVGEGRTVPVNELIALIGDEEDELPEDLGALAARAAGAQAGPDRASRPQTPEAMAAHPAAPPEEAPAAPSASPRARKVAAELKVPLMVLAGSGPGGRVVERDVLAYAERRGEARHTPAAAVEAYQQGVDLVALAGRKGAARVTKADVRGAADARPKPGERVPLTPMRRTIAQRMTASKQAAPHFYLVGEVMMRPALDLIRARAAQSGKVTVTGLLVKAVGLALREHPRVNARFDGDAVVLNPDCNVGVAVAVEDGLFVPVIRHADRKGLDEVSAELASLGADARAGRLIPGQYEGGSITLSNLGMFGVDYFLPIINPPESCIVGVGAVREQVVAVEGGMRIEPVMKVSVSADHRVVDGAEAARFFQTLKRLLEDPGGLA
jgi:pyruvate dehydrogenase E2 component (dihydrolipoamide acetyltransferase)